MADHRVEALTPQTWDAYARMMERHNGVFGGCWCTYFHTMAGEKTYDADDNRSLKQRLVEEGRAHAALVMDGDEAVAWAQYGSPDELPNIYHRKEYDVAGDAAARLPGHLHVRRQAVPAGWRHRARPARGARPHPAGGWRGGRGLPARHQ